MAELHSCHSRGPVHGLPREHGLGPPAGQRTSGEVGFTTGLIDSTGSLTPAPTMQYRSYSDKVVIGLLPGRRHPGHHDGLISQSVQEATTSGKSQNASWLHAAHAEAQQAHLQPGSPFQQLRHDLSGSECTAMSFKLAGSSTLCN